MLGTQPAVAPAGQGDPRLTLRELEGETLLFVLPGLYALAFLLVALVPQFEVLLPAFLLFLLVGGVWWLHVQSYLAGAWALVIGLLGIDLLVVAAGNLAPALCLLALPTGFATLFVNVAAGAAIGALCTVFLLLAPMTLVPADAVLRGAALIELWCTVGLISLVLRPVVTALKWSWSSYEQSNRFLEQARDQRLRLKQTLSDLADANLQLTRLNRLAQGLRRAAEDARRAKEQFVANVSHELRTPLNMIVGFVEMIMQTPGIYGRKLPSPLLADLAIVLQNSQHLSSLIDDVLDLSQVETGYMALTKERVSLAQIVDAATTAMRPLYDSKGLYLEAEVPDDLVLFCDRTRIRQVVLNLLSNAGRFTERGGVRVRAQREGGDALVSITDTGPGIAAEHMGRLFQPFQQLDGSIRRRHGGSGLGLCISKSFVELHGGKMWLESEKNVGTTLYFRLPIDAPTPLDERGVLRWFNPDVPYEQHTRYSQTPTSVPRLRLVVLESGQVVQRLLGRYLQDVEIARATNLEAALSELRRVPSHALVINDVSVQDALRRLEQVSLPEGVPAVICSVPGAQQAAVALGVTDYLVKPASRDELLAALERLNVAGQAILIVDDDPEAQQLFRRMLASAERDYRVLRAADGRQALSILRQEHPGAIVLDLLMPDMGGFQFLAAKSQDPALRDIPVVIVSAQDPTGQPIISPALAVTRNGGLSTPQLLACTDALTRILSLTGLTVKESERMGQQSEPMEETVPLSSASSLAPASPLADPALPETRCD